MKPVKYTVYLNTNAFAMYQGVDRADVFREGSTGYVRDPSNVEKTLSKIFDRHNGPANGSGERSISVGDVIELGKQCYAVERSGFKEVERVPETQKLRSFASKPVSREKDTSAQPNVAGTWADPTEERKPGIVGKVRQILEGRRLDKQLGELPSPDEEIERVLKGLPRDSSPEDERKELMHRMRTAVREAKAERREIKSELEHCLADGIAKDDPKQVRAAMKQAKDRGLMDEARVVPTDVLKEESRESRPSIRASKEARGKDGVIGSYRQVLLDQVDQSELSNYFASKEAAQTTDGGRKQVRQEAKEQTVQMLLGDRSFLNRLKADEGWKEVAAMYERWRAEIRNMPGADIIQIRREAARTQSQSAGRSMERW